MASRSPRRKAGTQKKVDIRAPLPTDSRQRARVLRIIEGLLHKGNLRQQEAFFRSLPPHTQAAVGGKLSSALSRAIGRVEIARLKAEVAEPIPAGRENATWREEEVEKERAIEHARIEKLKQTAHSINFALRKDRLALFEKQTREVQMDIRPYLKPRIRDEFDWVGVLREMKKPAAKKPSLKKDPAPLTQHALQRLPTNVQAMFLRNLPAHAREQILRGMSLGRGTQVAHHLSRSHPRTRLPQKPHSRKRK